MKLPPFRLERFFAEHEFSAPHLLCCSDCESFRLSELLALEDGAGEALHALPLGYTESPGGLALRQEIAGLYQHIGADDVLVHSGAEEAIFTFMHAALDPGDHLIVHAPCYQSLTEVARSIGCEVSPWKASETTGWTLDLDDLRRLLRPNSRAIVINTPHNPTGYLMPAADQQGLRELAQERGLIVFSDEVYRLLEYEVSQRLPAFCDLDEHAVSLGVMSKAFGLAGLRIGWAATRNRTLREKMAAIKDYTTICNSAPSEFLAALALRHREVLLQRNRQIIAANLQQLDAFFARHQKHFNWRRPTAGPIAFPSLRGRIDAGDFCRRLLRGTGVLLLPGEVYDATYTRQFRIGFGRKNLPDMLPLVDSFLHQHA